MTEAPSLSPSGEPLEQLPGTVKLYQRHVIVCTGRTGWPSHIETDGAFMQALCETAETRADDHSRPVKLTACDEPPAEGTGYDLLVFPDAVRYLSVTAQDLPKFVEDQLVGDEPSKDLRWVELSGQHVFVCTHANRDVRCGRCGSSVARAFRNELNARGLSNEVTVRRTSHLGQHSLAANVIVYPSGDWYGYVTPSDVGRIIDRHLVSGRVVTDLWRGRMGMSPDDQLEIAKGWTEKSD